MISTQCKCCATFIVNFTCLLYLQNADSCRYIDRLKRKTIMPCSRHTTFRVVRAPYCSHYTKHFVIWSRLLRSGVFRRHDWSATAVFTLHDQYTWLTAPLSLQTRFCIKNSGEKQHRKCSANKHNARGDAFHLYYVMVKLAGHIIKAWVLLPLFYRNSSMFPGSTEK